MFTMEPPVACVYFSLYTARRHHVCIILPFHWTWYIGRKSPLGHILTFILYHCASLIQDSALFICVIHSYTRTICRSTFWVSLSCTRSSLSTFSILLANPLTNGSLILRPDLLSYYLYTQDSKSLVSKNTVSHFAVEEELKRG